MSADAEFRDTGDTVTSQPRYAGFWIRVGAHLIDSLLIFAVTTALAFTYFALTSAEPPAPGTAEPQTSALDLVLWLLIAVAVIVFWRTRGATPGKMLCGLRIVNAETLGHLSTGQCIGRYFAYIVSALPLLLGYIWVGIDKRKQGFHDKLASTLVVRQADLADEIARLDV